MSILFSAALSKAATTVSTAVVEHRVDARLVRDHEGRITFAVNAEQADVSPDCVAALAKTIEELGAYASSDPIRFRGAYDHDDEYFSEGWAETAVSYNSGAGVTVYVKDLPAWGKDWLWLSKKGSLVRAAKRVAFHGLKGGVGRSTAIAVLAYTYAREGKKVLVVDLDLESPGLSGLLLSMDDLPPVGVVDWLVEDALNQGDDVLSDMVAESPLSKNESGEILVASAIGSSEEEYLAKLGRAYRDIDGSRGKERFSDRLERMLSSLEDHHKPHIVLLDSRAGLHEVAAAAITRLADLTLLFGVDTAQNWQGYHQMFVHWRSRPEVLREVRERVLMIRAMAGDAARNGLDRFVEKSFDLFSEDIYDEVGPGVPSTDVFSFDLNDTGAPHYPPVIYWDARFQEFNPLLPEERGGVGIKQIELAFGGFISRVRSAVDG